MSAFLHGIEFIEVESGIRPIAVAGNNVIGIVGTAEGETLDAEKWPLDKPVFLTKDTQMTGIGTGFLKNALSLIFQKGSVPVVVVRVEKGVDDAATALKVAGGIDVDTGVRTGLMALLDAKSIVQQRPKILCAELSRITAVATAIKTVSDRLRAVAPIDGPSSTDAAAISYAGGFDSGRMYCVDPEVKIAGDVDVPTSVGVAAILATINFWESPSNKVLDGVIGTKRPIEFMMGEEASQANILNAGNVATVINEKGFRLWGNRSLSADPKWQFLCVRRVADVIQDSLVDAHLWAVDKGLVKTYFEEVVANVNAFLRGLQTAGAILGGECWYDKEANLPADIMNGIATFDFDFGAVYPGERVRFRAALTDKYISNLF